MAVDEKVGPVLAGVNEKAANAVLEAIRELNPNVEVVDRGGYWRVLAPGECHVTRDAIERALGSSFLFPQDLEAMMPSFAGRLELNEDEAIWTAWGRRDAT